MIPKTRDPEDRRQPCDLGPGWYCNRCNYQSFQARIPNFCPNCGCPEHRIVEPLPVEE